MSRIAKKPIIIPAKTEVSLKDGFVVVKGPLGELKKRFKDDIGIAIEKDNVVLTLNHNSLQAKALWGTYASHPKNMI
jgi:large subunit ribosomal protein L6